MAINHGKRESTRSDCVGKLHKAPYEKINNEKLNEVCVQSTIPPSMCLTRDFPTRDISLRSSTSYRSPTRSSSRERREHGFREENQRVSRRVAIKSIHSHTTFSYALSLLIVDRGTCLRQELVTRDANSRLFTYPLKSRSVNFDEEGS